MSRNYTKKRAQGAHCRKRFAQRTDLTFTKELHDKFCALIQNNTQHPDDIKHVYRQSLRVTLWDIRHEEKIYRCVYDKQRKQIVTVISEVPPDKFGEL